MTQIEFRYLETVPTYLKSISESLKVIAQALSEMQAKESDNDKEKQ